MADHNKPVLTSTYANFVGELDARFDDLSVGLDPAVTSATNLPINAIRWNSVLAKDQKWNGSAWTDKSSFYALGSVRFNNGTVGSPSITFSDDVTTGFYKTAGELSVAVSGSKILSFNSGVSSFSNILYALNRGEFFGATGNEYNQTSLEVWGGGTTTPSTVPTIGFHQQGLYAGTLQMKSADTFALYRQGSSIFADLQAGNLISDYAVYAKSGFINTQMYGNSPNPIWRFGSNPTYGFTYFQGSSGLYGSDSIGFHFGDVTAAGSKFTITQDGRVVTHKNIVSGIAAPHDSGQNITVNGTGTTSSTAPYFTVNSRGLVAGDGSQFISGGLLFASYRDTRSTAYSGGITMQVKNVGDASTNPVSMDFRLGNTNGISFADDGNAALPPAPMSLNPAGELSLSVANASGKALSISRNSVQIGYIGLEGTNGVVLNGGAVLNLTGTSVVAPTVSSANNSTAIATTAFVKNQSYAALSSPALTGTPTAPTAATGTSTSQIATTAYVQSNALGMNQTWQSFNSTARASGTTYTNDTGRPICIAVTSASSTSSSVAITVSGSVIIRSVGQVGGGVFDASATVIVPAGATYSALYTAGSWFELR